MSTRSVPLRSDVPQPQRPGLQVLKPHSLPRSVRALRIGFWTAGVLLAAAQAWIFRYQVSSDSISYLDMSDGLLPGGDWHRLINAVWSPLYPFLLGIFRRLFHISAGNEIAVCHVLNILIFIFTFASFEFFLRGATGELESFDAEEAGAPLPKWAFLAIGYSLFLWAAIDKISVAGLRADMLMAGILYLAVGVLLRMRQRPARWPSYLLLGALLGLGFLSKEAMLPIGVLILAITLFVVKDWLPALKMAGAALALMFLIGSLYFIPLSRQLGHFTLGETSTLNYVVHVDEASPHWYLQDPGSARGSLLHPPHKIFSDPPAYAFPVPAAVTHPLRFDLLYWIAGLRPHFVWSRQIKAVMTNLSYLKEPMRELRAVAAAVLVLAFLCVGRKQIIAAIKKAWPVWLIGLAGCLMYLAIYVEPRYVAALFTLFFLGLILGFPVPRETGSKIAALTALAIAATLLYPITLKTTVGYIHRPHFNADFQAAQELLSLGVKPGDRVARITPIVYDYAVERILRVQIVAEVDRDHAGEFWDRPLAAQQDLLQAFAAQGARAVIATSPKLRAENQSAWKRLGETQYWVWRPAPTSQVIALVAIAPPISVPGSRPIPTTAAGCWQCRSSPHD